MAAITVNNFAKPLVTESSRHPQDINFVTQIERFIYDVRRDILNNWDWEWRFITDTLTTVASTPAYQLDPTVGEIRYIQLAGSYDRVIPRVTISDLVDMNADLALEGVPEYWYPTGYNTSLQENEITFWPIPNDAYTIYIDSELRTSDLTTSSNIDLPETMYTVLRDGVRAYIARFDGDDARAEKYDQKFLRGLELARRKQAIINSDRSRRRYTDVPGDNAAPNFLPRNYPRVW